MRIIQIPNMANQAKWELALGLEDSLPCDGEVISSQMGFRA